MLVAGVLLIILGVISILFPVTIGISAELFYGAIMMAAGAIYFTVTWRATAATGLGRKMLSFIIFGVGLLLFLYPMVGLFSIALIIGVGLFVQGIVQIASAASGGFVRGGTIVFVNGILGVIAGGIILYRWPFDSAWVLGIILGINLIVLGLTLLTLKRD